MTSAGPQYEPFAERLPSRNLAYIRASLPASAAGDQPSSSNPAGMAAQVRETSIEGNLPGKSDPSDDSLPGSTL
jgi:hypothetical protein